MKDLVSIIVTSYNHGEYLKQRMESLLNQTYSNIEIVVVDDSSKDNSLEVLNNYKEHEKVTLHSFQKNQGYAHACNFGIELCHGDFIMFAECDDFNSPKHVECLMECFLTYPNIGVAFCRSNMVDSNGIKFSEDFRYREKTFKDYCRKDTVITSRAIQRFFLIHCVIPNMSAALIRRKYFEEVKGLDSSFRVCADWDFWCRISRLCDFYYTTKPLSNFRTHRTTVRNTAGVADSMKEILRLLNRASSKIRLSSSEYFKFNVNLGLIWAGYFTSNPEAWVRDFLKLLKESSSYNRWSLFYLLAGFIMKIKTSVSGKFTSNN